MNSPTARRPSRRWAPRYWLGSTLGRILRLMVRNRFAVDWRFLPVALADGLASPMNSLLSLAESAIYGRRLKRHPLCPDPLFVLGHWRTGTTLLHELLALDPEHVAPSIIETVTPGHFLLTAGALSRMFRFLVPEQRPMDNMLLNEKSPLEDDYALVLQGARSPYETLAFPRHGLMTPEMFDPETFPEVERKHWERAMSCFVARLELRHPGRRPVLKSPPHMCRLRTLHRLFPEARYIQIIRHPQEVFPSMVHTWKRMYAAQSYQKTDQLDFEEMVFSLFVYMNECLERDAALIPASRFLTVRYEDLVADPEATLRRIYTSRGQ